MTPDALGTGLQRRIRQSSGMWSGWGTATPSAPLKKTSCFRLSLRTTCSTGLGRSSGKSTSPPAALANTSSLPTGSPRHVRDATVQYHTFAVPATQQTKPHLLKPRRRIISTVRMRLGVVLRFIRRLVLVSRSGNDNIGMNLLVVLMQSSSRRKNHNCLEDHGT